MPSGYVLTYNSVSSSAAVPELIVQKVRRPFAGAQRDVYVEVPGREGSWLFTEQPGDGTIGMDVTLVSSTNQAGRRAAVRKLAAYLRSSTRRALVINDEPDRLWWAKLSVEPDVDEMTVLGRTSLTFRCSPYAEAIATSETSQAASGVGDTKTFAVTGDADIRMAPVIEYTTAGAAASGIEFVLNGITIGNTESLSGGTTRTFSTLSATVTLGGQADEELAANGYAGGTLAMTTVYGDFGYLVPGTNTISFTKGSGTARIVWRRRYA